MSVIADRLERGQRGRDHCWESSDLSGMRNDPRRGKIEREHILGFVSGLCLRCVDGEMMVEGRVCKIFILESGKIAKCSSFIKGVHGHKNKYVEGYLDKEEGHKTSKKDDGRGSKMEDRKVWNQLKSAETGPDAVEKLMCDILVRPSVPYSLPTGWAKSGSRDFTAPAGTFREAAPSIPGLCIARIVRSATITTEDVFVGAALQPGSAQQKVLVPQSSATEARLCIFKDFFCSRVASVRRNLAAPFSGVIFSTSMFTLALVKFFCDFVIPCEFPFDPPSPERPPRARHISEITAAAPGRTHPHYRRYVFDRGVPFFERTDSRRAVANSQDCVVPGVKRVVSANRLVIIVTNDNSKLRVSLLNRLEFRENECSGGGVELITFRTKTVPIPVN
ncbi:hypothetical protein GEV33_012304 [Tenebrio molitor]|uniref:Uncharacterized protein n=1 Tax=Tenebrio molitor TaxID=7067 RepID=A0A8J6HAG8_TENMO|nr:hypothetical protein GEV33_012304 [Tenebrio molitor]